jgi:hypothetical protein
VSYKTWLIYDLTDDLVSLNAAGPAQRSTETADGRRKNSVLKVAVLLGTAVDHL